MEMLIAASENMPLATTAPSTQPADLGGDVGDRVAPADAAEARVGERDDRVEVPAGDRAEHEDDREQAGCRGGGVLEQLQANVVRGERLRRDARADHERGKEGRAEQLGEQPAGERGRVAGGHGVDRITSTDVSVN